MSLAGFCTSFMHLDFGQADRCVGCDGGYSAS